MRRTFPIAIVLILVATFATAAGSADTGVTASVNVNTASLEELQLLPRVGPALAQRIVDFREANGPFQTADELVAVRGIGERSLESLKPYVVVEGKTTLDEKVRLPRRSKTDGEASD
jgi:competence protein ComEA